MSIMGETNEVISLYFKNKQRAALSGAGHWHNLGEPSCLTGDPDYDECMGTDTLDLLEQELHYALEQVNILRLHTHVWNEHGFCSMCGWDGNA